MAAILRGVLAALLISIALCEPEKGSPKYVTISAAYGYRGYFSTEIYLLFLYAGDEVQILYNREARRVKPALYYGVSADMTLTAVLRESPDRTFYYGATKVFMDDEEFPRTFKYERGRGSPDAAGHKGKHMYLFYGCRMVEKGAKNKWASSRNLPEMGLPCNVDAAWSEKDDMAILKGDQVWWWKADGSVEGPVNFADHYKLLDNWVLKPSEK